MSLKYILFIIALYHYFQRHNLPFAVRLTMMFIVWKLPLPLLIFSIQCSHAACLLQRVWTLCSVWFGFGLLIEIIASFNFMSIFLIGEPFFLHLFNGVIYFLMAKMRQNVYCTHGLDILGLHVTIILFLAVKCLSVAKGPCINTEDFRCCNKSKPGLGFYIWYFNFTMAPELIMEINPVAGEKK